MELFLKHSSRKNCVVIKIFKKQVRIKELENRDEAKRKARNKNVLVKSRLKYRADSSAYDNLLDMHILLLQGKKQPLADVPYFSDVL